MDVQITGIMNQYQGKVTTENRHAFSENKLHQVFRFHSSVPGYEPTPLHSLTALSKRVGVANIYVKDESERFGLNAFKGLGASYAMVAYFANKYEFDLQGMDFSMIHEKIQSLPKVIFATTTAGNHGKGVAWAAKLLGQQAKVFMPKGTSPMRVDAIKELDAEAFVTDKNYDDTVSEVASLSQVNDWVLLQDTAWSGYEKLPLSIMQGYTSIILEIIDQLKNTSIDEVTHVFLQAGVGSFAAAIAAVIENLASNSSPKIIIVEPLKADCYYQSALDSSGNPQRVYGDLATKMAGLSCGEPSPIAWDILKNSTSYFFSCSDAISEKGMSILGNPHKDDPKITSGASGAVTMGTLYELMTNKNFAHVKQELALDKASKVLLISTEGDTDPMHYQGVVSD